jgi:hypothetical protein
MLKHYDFQEAQELMYNKEVLTAEEAEMCFQMVPAMAKEYLFHHSWNNTYLNLYVYSEVEHDRRQFEMEIGG